jgi:tRNA(adenine34) deaminase
METSRDEYFMRLALEQARIATATSGAGEVGCAIVRGGHMLAAGHTEEQLSHDPTAHAEIVTLRRLGQQLASTDFSGCTLYCTVEPCAMCSMACILAKIDRIVYGAARNDVHPIEGRHNAAADFVRDAFDSNIQVTGGVLAAECASLCQPTGELPDQQQPEGIPSPPMVAGIAETSLYVADLERSEQFYARVFCFRPVYSEPGVMVALAIPNRQMLLLFRMGAAREARTGRVGTVPGHDARGRIHLAFSISKPQLPEWERRLGELNVPIESRTRWPRNGFSLYFRDPDGHLLELITPGCWPEAPQGR